MKQTDRNTRDQVMNGDFPQVVEDSLLSASESYQEIILQLFSDPEKMKGFQHLAY